MCFPMFKFSILWNRSLLCDMLGIWSLCGYFWHLVATKQLYKWFCLYVSMSVCLSHLFNYVPIIVSSCNFHKLLPMTIVMSMQKFKVRGQRSRSQRSKPQLSCLGTITPVWIHIWWGNDTKSFMFLRRGVLLIFKVIRQIPWSHG